MIFLFLDGPDNRQAVDSWQYSCSSSDWRIRYWNSEKNVFVKSNLSAGRSKKFKLILLTICIRGTALIYHFPLLVVFVHSIEVHLIRLASVQIRNCHTRVRGVLTVSV